jgi:hypothetical protein
MGPFNEAEEIFLNDIRQKKKETASRLNSQKFKRLGKGKVRFAADFMSKKEKKKYMGAGEIMTSNIYDTILPADEFLKLEKHEQRNRLAYLRTKYNNKQIMKGMGLSNAAYYALVNEHGLPKAPRTYTEKPKRKATAKAAVAIEPQAAPAPATTATSEIEKAAPIQELIINGLHLVFNGTYSSDQIIKQLLKFGALLEGEEDHYYIEMKLMQKPQEDAAAARG